MRSYVVVALAAAIVACLAQSVSAGGYGHGNYGSYAAYQKPIYGYRVYRQRYLIHPGSGGYGYNAGGFGYNAGGLYGGNYGGVGSAVGAGIGTGINFIWWLLIIAFLLFLLNDK